MESLKCFINTDDIEKINNLKNFKPLFEYVDEPKYKDFQYDRREWGRLYFVDEYVTIMAASNIR